MKNRLKDVFKSGLQVVGIPVDAIIQDFDACVDLFKNPTLNHDHLDQMIKHIEAIANSIGQASSDDYKEEVDELKQACEDLTTKLRNQIQAHMHKRKSRLVNAGHVEALLEESNHQLTQQLYKFNSKLLLKKKLEEYRDDIVPYGKLQDLEPEGEDMDYEGTIVRIYTATYKKRAVRVKIFIGEPTKPIKVWRTEIEGYKRWRHPYLETMFGVSPPTEPNPYIVISPAGVDFRGFFQEPRRISEVIDLMACLETACRDLFRMGCYNWTQITVLPGGRPVVQPRHEDSRDLEITLQRITEDYITYLRAMVTRDRQHVCSSSRGCSSWRMGTTETLPCQLFDRTVDEDPEEARKLMRNNLKSHMIEEGSKMDLNRRISEELYKGRWIIGGRPIYGAKGKGPEGWGMSGPRLEDEKKSNTALQRLTSPHSLPSARHSRYSQANQCTIFGLRSVIPYVPASAYAIWQDTLLLLFKLSTNPAVFKQLAQDLAAWEAETTVDQDHTLMLVMARYTPPSPKSLVFGSTPEFRIEAGDICRFDDKSDGYLIREATSDGRQLYVGDMNARPMATSCLASYEGQVVEHTTESRRTWTSFTVNLASWWFSWNDPPETPTFGLDITLNLPPQQSQDTLWCKERRTFDSTPGIAHDVDPLSEFHLVVSISIIARIRLNSALSEHWSEIIRYQREGFERGWDGAEPESSNAVAENNPFAGMKLYFHRHNTAPASLREYWGFWSLNSDPTAETGLEDCIEEIKLEVTTLPMENDLDRKIKRREEERLAGIPGAWN